MRHIEKSFYLLARIAVIIALCAPTVFPQKTSVTIYGRVFDERGDVIVGARVAVVDSIGQARYSVSDLQGIYRLEGLAAGNMKVSAEAEGFARFEDQVEIQARPNPSQYDIRLRIILRENMVVEVEDGLSSGTGDGVGEITINESLLSSLPDDPDQLASALAALAGNGDRTPGGQVIVDGVSANRIPPKDLIREIRINRNPFSAEYDRPGSNAVEIFTKPGTEKLHGQVFLNLSHDNWNSRNPFSPEGAAFRSRLFGFSLSGSPVPGKFSTFFSLERRLIDDETVINATIIDPQFNVVPLRGTVGTPYHSTNLSQRFDYTVSSSLTLSARYLYSASESERAGLTAFSLPSTAYEASAREHSVSVNLLKAFSSKSFSDARFLVSSVRREDTGDNSLPSVNVLESFLGGGAQVGASFDRRLRWEMIENISWVAGRHTLRAGGRFRGSNIQDFSSLNFGGTYIFAGGLAPVLLDGKAQSDELAPISSIERFRRTQLLLNSGTSPQAVRELGGGATQFSITTGNPSVAVNQYDLGAFLLDDWKLRPNMTLSFGLRYEAQTNINSSIDLAPRLAFVWSPGGGKNARPKTVIRIGSGIFYDRLGEELSLEVQRYSGDGFRQFVVTDDREGGRQILDLFPDLPPLALLSQYAESVTTRRLNSDLRSPYTILSGINVERQIGRGLIFTATYSHRRKLHELRSRNTNAPDSNGLRPNPDLGNVFEFSSDAIFKQQQVSFQARYTSPRLMMLASYVWSKAESDSDGPFSFPSDSIQISNEFGRAAQDIRHSFYTIANFNGPLGITFSPLVTVRSGLPFNITTGSDTNLDGVLSDRPARATGISTSAISRTRLGSFDLNPGGGQQVISRNLGSGPGFFQLDLRLSKTFTPGAASRFWNALFGRNYSSESSADNRGEAKPQDTNKSSNWFRASKLTIALQAFNVTNTTNLGPVIGNLSSPLFGSSNTIIGGYGFSASNNPSHNRRVEFQIRYSF